MNQVSQNLELFTLAFVMETDGHVVKQTVCGRDRERKLDG